MYGPGRTIASPVVSGVLGYPIVRCHREDTVAVGLPGQVWLMKRCVSLLVPILAACAPSTRPATSDAALADTLKARIADAYDLARPGAAERMIGLYADSGRVISASGGLIVSSTDSLKAGIHAFWDNVGRNMQNPTWQWEEVYVERLAPDAAVLTGRWSIPHIAPTGHPHVIRGAWTAVFRHRGGRWVIVMEHLSTPPSGG